MDVTMSLVSTPDAYPMTVLAAPAIEPVQWMMLGSVAVVLASLVAWHRLGRDSGGRARAGDWRATQRDVADAMVQLDQLAQRIHQKIDVRLAKLDALIREADDRIDQLDRMQRTGAGAPSVDIQLAPESPEAPAASDDDPHQSIYQLADAGYTSLQIAKKLSRHTGEVELILSLRRARRATA
jgi:predicted trehalose synthase